MAFKSLNLSHREWVSLDCDPDKENPTQFQVRPLSARELSACKDAATTFRARAGTNGTAEEMDAQFNANFSNCEIVNKGLVNWKNFVTEDGVDVEFKKNKGVDLLPLDAVRELSDKIEKLSVVELDEAKPSTV